MCLASKCRSHRYQETAESKEELKYNCTEGLAEIPLNYAVDWVHLHSHISTIHVWAVSSSPRAILTRTHIQTSPLFQLKWRHRVTSNTPSITRTTWLTPHPYNITPWAPSPLLERVTVRDTNSLWPGFHSAGQWGKTKREGLDLLLATSHVTPPGLAGQWQFSAAFVMKSCGQLWPLWLIMINLVIGWGGRRVCAWWVDKQPTAANRMPNVLINLQFLLKIWCRQIFFNI